MDPGRVAVEVEARQVVDQRSRRSGDAGRRRREDVGQRARAHRRDDRVAVPGRDGRLELPAAPAVCAYAPVERPVGVQRLAAAVARACEGPSQRLNLGRAQAGVGLGAAALQVGQLEDALAALEVTDDAVDQQVQRIAACYHLVGDQLHVGRAESAADVGVDQLPALDVPGMLERGLGQVESGRAGQQAVVKIGVALGSDHRVATAVGAAGHVVALRLLAVMALDQRLSHRPDRAVGAVAIVAPGLRVQAKQVAAHQTGSCVGRVFALMARIAADHREAARQRIGRQHAHVAQRRLDDAVVAAVDLVQKALVPGLRQTHLEADRVALAIDTGTLAELALHQTVRRVAFVVSRHRAGLGDAQARQRVHGTGQLCAGQAGGTGRRCAAGQARRCGQQAQQTMSTAANDAWTAWTRLGGSPVIGRESLVHAVSCRRSVCGGYSGLCSRAGLPVHNEVTTSPSRSPC